MLRSKSTQNIWELKNGFTQRWVEPDFLSDLLHVFRLSTLLKCLQNIKQKGMPLELLISYLLCFPFWQQSNVNQFSHSFWGKQIAAGKDCFFRLLNNPDLDWRRILSLFVFKFLKVNLDRDSLGKGPRCLIIDDTTLPKTGQLLEGVSRVFDHVRMQKVLGFKLLVLSYWDGLSHIPIDFTIHREKGKNKDFPFGLKPGKLKKQFSAERAEESCGNQRFKELDVDKISAALQMLKRAVKSPLKIDYVLMDSWFTCKAMLREIAQHKGMHLLGMYKGGKTKFQYQNKEYTAAQLRNKLGKTKYHRKSRLYYLNVKVTLEGQEVQLFFSRKGKRGKWKILLSTDLSLNFSQALEIYHIRWGIEVFFKEAKQLLNLGKCQANNFDSQIATTSLVFMQYILLTMTHRYNSYETKGALFREVEEAFLDIRLSDRLWGLFLQIMNTLAEIISELDVEELMLGLLNKPEFIEKLLLPEQYLASNYQAA